MERRRHKFQKNIFAYIQKQIYGSLKKIKFFVKPYVDDVMVLN